MNKLKWRKKKKKKKGFAYAERLVRPHLRPKSGDTFGHNQNPTKQGPLQTLSHHQSTQSPVMDNTSPLILMLFSGMPLARVVSFAPCFTTRQEQITTHNRTLRSALKRNPHLSFPFSLFFLFVP